MTTKFWMVTEDPMYDEDGQLVDEDFDECEDPVEDTFDPFETVNS